MGYFIPTGNVYDFNPKHNPNLENTQERYEHQAKSEAQTFYTELFDLTARYGLSTLGDMERAGVGSVGETLMQAIAKLELLKQSL